MGELQELKPFMTVEEAAQMIGVHEQTIRRWLREEQMLGTMISRAAGYRIRREEVERVLEEGLRPGKLAA
jgi:excisionase family DNA binding protein